MIDELLARLEASTVKFDIGRGGIPQLTPQDIAAALGMCENKAASILFQAVAAGSVDWPIVDRVVATIQLEEWKRRAERIVDAQLAKTSAELVSSPRERKSMLDRADNMMAGAKAAMWPNIVEGVYVMMRRALISELRHNRICPVCNGRRSVQTDTVVVECQNCSATGRVSISDRQRAKSMGIVVSTYARVWRPVYEWMYIRLNDLVAIGRDQFREALGRVK